MSGFKIPSWLLPDPDPRGSGPLLFSVGHTDYERIRFLSEGPDGEQVLLGWRHSPGYLSERVVIRCLTRPHPRPEAWRRVVESALPVRLEHPSLARVIEMQRRRHVHYTVVEDVEGCSVADVLRDAARRGRPLSEAFALYVGAQVAGALHQAHAFTLHPLYPEGLVHRDVSPAHIRLSREGRVVLTHLETVWACLPERDPTAGGGPPGGLDYTAPERLLPEFKPWRQSSRADLFSLGVVLLELLTGRRLYAVPTLERRVDYGRRLLESLREERPPEALRAVEDAVLRAELLMPRDVEEATQGVSEPVRQVLRALLRGDPAERHDSAGRLEAELRACLKRHSRWYGARSARRELALLQKAI